MGFWTMVRFFFISLRFLTYTCTHARSMGNKENGERCPLSHTAVTVSLDIQVRIFLLFSGILCIIKPQCQALRYFPVIYLVYNTKLRDDLTVYFLLTFSAFKVFKYRGREERRGKILRSDIGYLTEGTQVRDKWEVTHFRCLFVKKYSHYSLQSMLRSNY